MKFFAYSPFVFSLLIVSSAVRSEIQEAHTHGLATLTLALENKTVEIQLESPSANLLGFEHKAKSAKEKKAVAKIKSILETPSLLFSFVGTQCQVKNKSVDVSGLLEDDHDHDEHEKHNGHEEHEEEHDHESHETHSADEHDHSEEHHHESEHSEISAHYRFSCKEPAKLKAVSAALFNRFPAIEKINAMWVTEAKQGAASLTSGKNVISLR